MISFSPTSATITAIECDHPDNYFFHLHLSHPLQVAPGQFVEISLPGIGEFPVSAAAWPSGEELTLCIRRVGRVTDALYRLPIGAQLGIRGPFGQGFPVETFLGHDLLLIAGGLGMVPLRTLLHWLLSHRQEVGEIILLYGSYDSAGLLFRQELEELATAGKIRAYFSIDSPCDELDGEKKISCQLGVVGDLLQNLNFSPATTVAALCGPPILYHHLLERLAALGVPSSAIFASLERRMKCGVGQCCHCVTAGVYVCCQGPVFSLDQLRTMPGAI